MKLVKNLLLFLFVVVFSGCGGDSSSDHEFTYWQSALTGKTATWQVTSSDELGSNFSVSEPGGTGTIKVRKDISGLYLDGIYGFSGVLSTSHFKGFTNVLLKLPVVTGDSWNHSESSNNYTLNSVVTVTSANTSITNLKGVTATGCVQTMETITAPSGYLSTTDIYSTSVERWLCPGYGPFKFIITYSDGVKSTTYLDTFTPAGAVDPSDFWPMTVGNSWIYKN